MNSVRRALTPRAPQFGVRARCGARAGPPGQRREAETQRRWRRRLRPGQAPARVSVPAGQRERSGPAPPARRSLSSHGVAGRAAGGSQVGASGGPAAAPPPRWLRGARTLASGGRGRRGLRERSGGGRRGSPARPALLPSSPGPAPHSFRLGWISSPRRPRTAGGGGARRGEGTARWGRRLWPPSPVLPPFLRPPPFGDCAPIPRRPGSIWAGEKNQGPGLRGEDPRIPQAGEVSPHWGFFGKSAPGGVWERQVAQIRGRGAPQGGRAGEVSAKWRGRVWHNAGAQCLGEGPSSLESGVFLTRAAEGIGVPG